MQLIGRDPDVRFVRGFADDAAVAGGALLALITSGAAAMAAPGDDDAITLFEQALDVPGADHWPFDLARIQLLFGERLFLSHRTVGTHLYQLFPKLGISSRAALRDALTSVPSGR